MNELQKYLISIVTTSYIKKFDVVTTSYIKKFDESHKTNMMKYLISKVTTYRKWDKEVWCDEVLDYSNYIKKYEWVTEVLDIYSIWMSYRSTGYL